MKNINFWEKVFTILAFISAVGSAILNYATTGKNYYWQLMVVVWIGIAYIKQKTIEQNEDKK